MLNQAFEEAKAIFPGYDFHVGPHKCNIASPTQSKTAVTMCPKVSFSFADAYRWPTVQAFVNRVCEEMLNPCGCWMCRNIQVRGWR